MQVTYTWEPFLSIYKYFRACDIHSIPRKSKAQLFGRRQVLTLKKSCKNRLIKFLGCLLWSICDTEHSNLKLRKKHHGCIVNVLHTNPVNP